MATFTFENNLSGYQETWVAKELDKNINLPQLCDQWHNRNMRKSLCFGSDVAFPFLSISICPCVSYAITICFKNKDSYNYPNPNKK